MANPKRRHSKSRRDKRRANWKAESANTSLCPQCHQPKLSHMVCPHCGYYNGKHVITVAEPKK